MKKNTVKLDYGSAILSAFEYLLDNYPEVFIIGQGLWSPWYVGNSMTGLDKKYGTDRILDTPVSESACTGAAIGASLVGMKPIVVHPRMDFMLYAMDAIVNQAAKWSYMFGGKAHPAVTIRSIINRGGEQGAQHSQALHSWFAHVPGLRVVMPSTVQDARDLLIASVLCSDPVLYIDDRWLYKNIEEIPLHISEKQLSQQSPNLVFSGNDITLVGSGYASFLIKNASSILLNNYGIKSEVIDLRVLNPFDCSLIVKSVQKTRNLLVVDSGCNTAGFAAEVIASVCENVSSNCLNNQPKRLTLPNTPAPSSSALEKYYYTTIEDVVIAVKNLLS